MAGPVMNDRTEGDIMGRIREGMEVYDSNQKKVGKVDRLFMGARADALTTGAVLPDNDTLLDDAVEGVGDSLPPVVRSRMRNNGFIRVHSGLLRRNRCALREHIASVAGDRVILNIRGEDMISA